MEGKQTRWKQNPKTFLGNIATVRHDGFVWWVFWAGRARMVNRFQPKNQHQLIGGCCFWAVLERGQVCARGRRCSHWPAVRMEAGRAAHMLPWHRPPDARGRRRVKDAQHVWNGPTRSNHFLGEGTLLMTEASVMWWTGLSVRDWVSVPVLLLGWISYCVCDDWGGGQDCTC